MTAPYLTKSTESLVRGAKSLKASIKPVPAQPIPTAIAAPYLKWGLYDSASYFNNSGSFSGVLNNKNPKFIKAALLTSSLTSLTAWWSNF